MGFGLVLRLVAAGEEGFVDGTGVGILGDAVTGFEFRHVRVLEFDELLGDLGGRRLRLGRRFQFLVLDRLFGLGRGIGGGFALQRLVLGLELGASRLHFFSELLGFLFCRVDDDHVLLLKRFLALYENHNESDSGENSDLHNECYLVAGGGFDLFERSLR